MPNSARSPDTAEAIRSRKASGWSSMLRGGTVNARSTASGSPALLPGV